MAFKTQSRKRTKSWTNLLDNSDNFNPGGQQKSSSNPFRTTGNLSGDFDIDSSENISANLKKTPPKKSLLSKGRHFSQMYLMNPTERYQIDDAIIETNEEDNMT